MCNKTQHIGIHKDIIFVSRITTHNTLCICNKAGREVAKYFMVYGVQKENVDM